MKWVMYEYMTHFPNVLEYRTLPAQVWSVQVVRTPVPVSKVHPKESSQTQKDRCYSGHASSNNGATVAISYGNVPLSRFIPAGPTPWGRRGLCLTRFNKIAIPNNKFQMVSGQGSHWLIDGPTMFSSMCSPPLSNICQFYF